MARWAVIGGGVLGLMLAHRLRRRGRRRHPHRGGPRARRAGRGVAASADVTWDRHYHVTLLSDPRTRAMLGVAGLERRAAAGWRPRPATTAPTACCARCPTRSSSSSCPGLSPLDKAPPRRPRSSTARRSATASAWRRIPVDAWLRRWSGERTFERFWLPLLRAKLGDAYQQASAAFIWATIQRLYAARRSGLKKEMFGYVPGGYARIVRALRRRCCTAEGVKLELGAPVAARPAATATASRCRRRRSATERFDDVVVTAAGPLAADLCPDLDRAEQAAAAGGALHGRRVRLAAAARAAGALLPHLHHRPRHAVHRGGRDDAVRRPGRDRRPAPRVPAEVRRARRSAVRRRRRRGAGRASCPTSSGCTPHLRDDDVLAFRVSRVRRVFAVPTLGLLGDACRRWPRRCPGLHLVGSAQLPFATLNVNDTLVDFVEELGPMKPLRLAVARPRQPVVVPDDPRRRGLGRLRLLPRRRSCPRVLELLARPSAAHHRSSSSARTPPWTATRRRIRAIADAGHEIGNHSLPAPALAAPVLARRDPRRAAPGRGRHRGRHRPAHGRVPWSRLQPVGRRPAASWSTAATGTTARRCPR